jgi:AcrR family transcriptional regulator
MRSRKEEEYEQRRQQILEGALHVFAEKGFEKATNKDIASAAGIGSPGLIYHYFVDKAALFRQVIEQHAPALQLIAQPETVMAMPPREALQLFASKFLQILDNPTTVAFLKVMVGEVTRKPEVADMVNNVGPGRAFPLLTRYLEQQMAAGTLRRMDAGAAVRCFIGPILAYIIAREVFPQADSQTLNPEMMVETLVDVFLHGTAAQ